jgi:hypothetical protein
VINDHSQIIELDSIIICASTTAKRWQPVGETA